MHHIPHYDTWIDLFCTHSSQKNVECVQKRYMTCYKKKCRKCVSCLLMSVLNVECVQKRKKMFLWNVECVQK